MARRRTNKPRGRYLGKVNDMLQLAHLADEETRQLKVYANGALSRAAGRCHYLASDAAGGVVATHLDIAAPVVSDAAMLQLVLAHEAAHAHAGYYANHGPVWRAACTAFGGDGRAKYDMGGPLGQLMTSGHPIQAVCERCQESFRMPRRPRWTVARHTGGCGGAVHRVR